MLSKSAHTCIHFIASYMAADVYAFMLTIDMKTADKINTNVQMKNA